MRDAITTLQRGPGARRKLGEKGGWPKGKREAAGRSPLIKLLSNTGSMASVLGQVITSSRGPGRFCCVPRISPHLSLFSCSHIPAGA